MRQNHINTNKLIIYKQNINNYELNLLYGIILKEILLLVLIYLHLHT